MAQKNLLLSIAVLGAGLAGYALRDGNNVQSLKQFADPDFFRNLIRPAPYKCEHNYNIEMISQDPLMIYINGFLTPYEIKYLVEMSANAEYALRNSSKSYFVPPSDPVSLCITQRAELISGFLPWNIFEELQIVRYHPKERHDLHRDSLKDPVVWEGIGNRCNRLLSLFIYIQDDCTGGETYFPHLKAAPEDSDDKKFAFTKTHPDRGLVVRPVAGNGLFWVNLLDDYTTDNRTKHAALEVHEGTKLGMNILGVGCW